VTCSSLIAVPYSAAARLIAMLLLRLQGRYPCFKIVEFLLDLP